MNKKVILAALATITLTACSNVDDEQYADFTSPVEATFTGKVSAAQTRANDAEEWSAEYTTIGISAKTLTKSERTTAQYANVRYTAKTSSDDATNATLTPVSKSTDSTFYFQTPKERASFVAYAPYIDTTATTTTPDLKNGVITLHAKSETAGSEDYNVTDYIRAETGTLNYLNNTEALEFTHQMSKLNITVGLSDEVSGKTASSSDANTYTYTTIIEKVELSNLITDGTLTLSTGDIALTDGATARTVSLEVGSDGLTATLSDYIVIPQSGLVVTITTDDNQTYQTTLSKSLVSGNAYTFNITAKKSAVEVTATIVPWNNNDEEKDNAKMIKTTIDQFEVFSDVSKVKQYDLAFSDGSFMRLQDENGNLPEDIPAEYLTEDLQKKLSGIVYYLGDVTADDPILKRDYPNCTHGLIVALNDLEDIQSNTEVTFWQKTYYDVYTNFQCAEDSKYSVDKGYEKIMLTYLSSKELSEEDLAIANRKLGYNNTTVLRAFNKDAVDDYKVVLVSKVDGYENSYTAPINSSGWYLPSLIEVALLEDNDVVISAKMHEAISTTRSVWNNLTSIIAILKNKQLCEGLNSEYAYLSSLQCCTSDNSNYIYSPCVAWNYDLNSMYIYYCGYADTMNPAKAVAVCAF